MEKNIKNLINEYYESVLEVYDDIYNIIVLNLFDLQEHNKNCDYCRHVLTWLVYWENDFEDFGLSTDEASYVNLRAQVNKLYDYLKNHDIFGCNDGCKVWKNETLNKDVYKDLPDLVKAFNEKYQALAK